MARRYRKPLDTKLLYLILRASNDIVNRDVYDFNSIPKKTNYTESHKMSLDKLLEFTLRGLLTGLDEVLSVFSEVCDFFQDIVLV